MDPVLFSPDLASCNFWLFLKLEVTLNWTHFVFAEEVEAIVMRMLREFPRIAKRRQKCINSKGGGS